MKDIGGGGLLARWRVVDNVVVRGARSRGLQCDVGRDQSWGKHEALRGYCRSSHRW